MLKIRTFISLVVSVLLVMTTYQFVVAGAEIISIPSNNPADVISSQGGSTYQFVVSSHSYPSTLVECIDLPGVAASVVACPNPSQIPAMVISDPAGFPQQFKVSGPLFPSIPVECIDMPGVVGSVVACANPSQIPAPEWWIRAHKVSNH